MNAAARGRYDFRGLIRRAHPDMTPEQELAGWHMLRQRGLLRDRRVRRLRVALFGVGVALGSGGLAYYCARPSAVEALQYSASGVQLSSGGALRVESEQGGYLRFSNGSVVRLAKGSTARVLNLTPEDVRLRVGEGTLEGAIEGSEQAPSFEFDLDAYVLRTVDAAFVARLNEADETLEVRIFSGALELEGPLANDGLVLRGGQTLSIRRREGAIFVRDATNEDLSGTLGHDQAG